MEGPDRTFRFWATMRRAGRESSEFFRSRATVPAGRAERLGLVEVEAQDSRALELPFEFLSLGDDRGASAELEGQIAGFGARVFEFKADEFVGSGPPGSGGGMPYSFYRYHVAAVELGFELPWLAVAVRKVPSRSQAIRPDRPKHELQSGDRRIDRLYALYCDDLSAARTVLSGPVLDWLVESLSVRFQHRTPAAIEVSRGWALAAIQSGPISVPDDIEVRASGQKGHPGPWPDVLLSLLADFRARARPI